MHSTRGVIFDIDGVLVDSGAAHRRAWRKLGEEVGVPFGDDLFARTFGQRNDSIVPTWLGEGVSARRVEELGERKEELYRDLVRCGEVRIYPRVTELMRELGGAGFAVAVASSGPRANVDLIIDVIGAKDVVSASIAAEDVRHGKPHPEAFLTAAARIGVEPERCAVIEDSTHGIEAAKTGGMLAVALLTSTPREKLVAAGADLIAGEAGELSVEQLEAGLRSRRTGAG
jgi:beta-phosphoglucomutase family hydrolase